MSVRALVRSATKARDVLACSACDESEGIYLGDVTQEDPLARAAEGASSLAIVTSSAPVCSADGCSYPEGQYPVDIDWQGGIKQVTSFVKANGGRLGHVALVSSAGTTTPNGPLDLLGEGYIGFYKLNLEAFLMSSGVPFTIVKPCGLADAAGGQSELRVGHHDSLTGLGTIARADVVNVLAEALLLPMLSANLRFDLCSEPESLAPQLATTSIPMLLASARSLW